MKFSLPRRGGGQTGTILEVLGGHGAAESAAGTERPAAACWERPAHGERAEREIRRREGSGSLQEESVRSSGN